MEAAIKLKNLEESRLAAWFINSISLAIVIGINWAAILFERLIYEEMASMMEVDPSNHTVLIIVLVGLNLYLFTKLIGVNHYLNSPWERMKEIALSLPGFVGITRKSGQLVIESCSNDFSDLIGENSNLVGQQVMLTLFTKDHVHLGSIGHEQLSQTLQSMIGEPESFFRSKIQDLPKQISISRPGQDDRVLELTYEANQLKRFRKEDVVRGIIIGLKDITEKIRMEKEAAKQQAILDKQREINTRQRLAMKTMLNNIHQGVFTINTEQVVEPNYSAHLTTILETDTIEGQNVVELLFHESQLSNDQIDQIRTALRVIIEGDEMAVAFNSHLLINQFEKKKSDGTLATYTLEWIPIFDQEDTVEKMMITIRDITKTLALESEVAQQKRESDIVLEILAVSQDQFFHFLTDSNNLLDQCQTILEEQTEKDPNTIAALFRLVHTIKGNARTYNFAHLTPIVHDVEQEYVAIRDSEEIPWEQEKLITQLDSVRKAISEYETLSRVKLGRNRRKEDSRDTYHRIPIKKVTELMAYLETKDNQQIDKARHELALLGSAQLKDFLTVITESLPELANVLGKPLPQVIIEDHNINIKAPIINMLKNIFMHSFRNTMDHGIKDQEHVEIHLEAALKNNNLQLTYYDNGCGLNLFEIQKRAYEKKLVEKTGKLSPQKTANLIFISGFSTAKQVTDISGRGVGMDAIKKMIQQAGGTIELQLKGTPDTLGLCPFQLVITLPSKFGILREYSDYQSFAESQIA